jgi:hypothetical protein
MENKTCKQCSKGFVIEDEDLDFYKKISPTFNSKNFEIPSPTLCIKCREIRRLAWRNEVSLYRHKCDKTGKDIISMFSPNKPYKVYETEEWWKDDWDATEYAQEFDPSKSFFDQFEELIKKVPRNSLMNTNTENCKFSNYIAETKDCYMCFTTYFNSEKMIYSKDVHFSKNCVDCLFVDHIENCYECLTTNACYGCKNSIRLSNCRDCYFSIDLTGCSDCLLCSNLQRKQYCINNKQLSKQEYMEKIGKYDFGSRSVIQELEKEFQKMRDNSFVKFANQIKCEDCQGDDLLECKNTHLIFAGTRVEDSKYSVRAVNMKNCIDVMGGEIEWCYFGNNMGYGSNMMCCTNNLYCNFTLYCDNCYNSKNLFACEGLRNKQYCIFNKQYTKDEYEKKVAEIIEKMIENNEWGEFFPMSSAPFGYNETMGQLYYPLTKEEATKYGGKWQDEDFSLKHNGSFYEPEENIAVYQDEAKRNELLNGILKCEVTGRPFKITPQELAFYIEQKIPVPSKHYNTRFDERFHRRNQFVLYKRQCMCEESGHAHGGRCTNKFETTYASDRPEKVYCEKCYQRSVI